MIFVEVLDATTPLFWKLSKQ